MRGDPIAAVTDFALFESPAIKVYGTDYKAVPARRSGLLLFGKWASSLYSLGDHYGCLNLQLKPIHNHLVRGDWEQTIFFIGPKAVGYESWFMRWCIFMCGVAVDINRFDKYTQRMRGRDGQAEIEVEVEGEGFSKES